MRQFLKDGEVFFQRLLNELLSRGFAPAELGQADHLCFRVASMTEYEKYKSFLSRDATLLTEAKVNGRLICTFRMNAPFRIGDHCIDLVELPAPKEGRHYETGFEHAEFVISHSFENFKKLHSNNSFEPNKMKVLNSELCLNTPVGQVKFHHLPLNRVIEIEEKKVTDIVFDFDGTLIRSMQQIIEINRQVFSHILSRDIGTEESKAKLAASFPALFRNFGLSDPGKQQEAIQMWSSISSKEKFELFDGVEVLLKTLFKSGLHLHLWTSRDESSTRKILDQHDLESLFSTVNCANINSSKPDPKNLSLDFAKLSGILMIGDTSTDMLAAKNIGAILGAACWDPDVNKNELYQSGAELIFTSPNDLHDYFLDPFE